MLNIKSRGEKIYEKIRNSFKGITGEDSKPDKEEHEELPIEEAAPHKEEIKKDFKDADSDHLESELALSTGTAIGTLTSDGRKVHDEDKEKEHEEKEEDDIPEEYKDDDFYDDEEMESIEFESDLPEVDWDSINDPENW